LWAVAEAPPFHSLGAERGGAGAAARIWRSAGGMWRIAWRVLALLLTLALPACGGGSVDSHPGDGSVDLGTPGGGGGGGGGGKGDGGHGNGGSDGAVGGGDGGGSGGDGGGSTGDGGAPGTCDNIAGDRRQQVCLHWQCDRRALGEGSWSGNVASCSAGDISSDGRTHALTLVNLYRFLADLPVVANDGALDQKAQACALMMDANNALSHAPPATWKCYSADGAGAAGSSNISSTAGVTSVDLYMGDSGNETTLGHRRWILSNSLGPIGLGSTSDASCLLVIGGKGKATKPWMSWPPPGPFPFAAVSASPFGGTLDVTGWSLQSSGIDLTGATVAISDGTQSLPVTSSTLGQNYGSTYAIRWLPSGWKTQAGHSYDVTVTPKSGTAIHYTIDVVDCG
jgi:cysteine-rich secretory family protein